MALQRVADLHGSEVETFRATLRGEVLRPGDDGYDHARTLHNTMIDRRPGMIVRCAGVADVIACVDFARRNELLLAVRGGGHHVTGNALCDDGIVIDLTRMKGLRVDPVARTVGVEPGVTWGELNHDLQPFGVALLGRPPRRRRGVTSTSATSPGRARCGRRCSRSSRTRCT
jgi:FAD/FMN-containing dehydrogenase